jgi:sugar phosphate isomerase/epimerase
MSSDIWQNQEVWLIDLPHGIHFGYMNSQAERLAREAFDVASDASFIEIQVHDQQRDRAYSLTDTLANSYRGYATIHCEGETDGKRRLHFASPDAMQRNAYLHESLNLIATAIHRIMPWQTRRVILHPDTIWKGAPRQVMIEALAQSIEGVRDALPDVDVCIEPRGGDRQRKVLRLDIGDLETLTDDLRSSARIGLCIDLAQLYVTKGTEDMVQFLRDLRGVGLPIKEIHASDVQSSGSNKKVAMEIGKGEIDWPLVLPPLLERNKDILIETLGGVPVFRRSKSYIEEMLHA